MAPAARVYGRWQIADGRLKNYFTAERRRESPCSKERDPHVSLRPSSRAGRLSTHNNTGIPYVPIMLTSRTPELRATAVKRIPARQCLGQGRRIRVGHVHCILHPIRCQRNPAVTPSAGRTCAGYRCSVGFVAVLAASCLQGQKATDTGDPGFPFGPSAIGVQPLAYQQDVKPIFDRDCLVVSRCAPRRRQLFRGDLHGDDRWPAPRRREQLGRRRLLAGRQHDALLSGDAVTEATIVFRWMVYYNAQQSR
mgnify:CR=1 FL=1